MSARPSMPARFAVGSYISRREVLHGQAWLATPIRVVNDEEVLALWLAEGTPFTFPPHPYGPHPYAGRTRWTGTSLLQLHRPGEAYAVWGWFRGGRFLNWYVNFQAPYRRTMGGIDTLDYGLDIVLDDDGWRWKDREDVAGYVASGRLTAAEAKLVWEQAEVVAAALSRGERWWAARWNGWAPDPTWSLPPSDARQPRDADDDSARG